MKRFKYTLPGSANCYDIKSESEQEARKAIRKFWKLSYYMSKKVEIWESSQTVDEEISEKREHLKDVLAANSHLCLTDF